LEELVRFAKTLPGLEVWLFGSALQAEEVRDIDVLVVYLYRDSVIRLRAHKHWSDRCPPCNIIAMTRREVAEYGFIDATGAIRLV